MTAETGASVCDEDPRNGTIRRESIEFRLVSLSTIIDHIAECPNVREEKIGISELQTECSRMKGTLDALRVACDKGSSLE